MKTRLKAGEKSAVRHFLGAHARKYEPTGHRWNDKFYPSTTLMCCASMGAPTDDDPARLLRHQRSLEHIAAVHRITPQALAGAVRHVKSALGVEENGSCHYRGVEITRAWHDDIPEARRGRWCLEAIPTGTGFESLGEAMCEIDFSISLRNHLDALKSEEPTS